MANRKYFLKLILSIGFQFWEPLRGALHHSNLYLFYIDLLSEHSTGHVKIFRAWTNFKVWNWSPHENF